MMQKNEVTSLNAQPLILKVVVWSIRRHVWHSPRILNSKPTQLPGSSFSRCNKHPAMVGPWGSHLIILHHFLTTTVYFAVAIGYLSPQINKPISPKHVVLLFFSAISASDMFTFLGQVLWLPIYLP